MMIKVKNSEKSPKFPRKTREFAEKSLKTYKFGASRGRRGFAGQKVFPKKFSHEGYFGYTPSCRSLGKSMP